MAEITVLTGDGPCAACDHDPACGRAQINDDWYCHADDHSCYTPNTWKANPLRFKLLTDTELAARDD